MPRRELAREQFGWLRGRRRGRLPIQPHRPQPLPQPVDLPRPGLAVEAARQDRVLVFEPVELHDTGVVGAPLREALAGGDVPEGKSALSIGGGEVFAVGAPGQ